MVRKLSTQSSALLFVRAAPQAGVVSKATRNKSGAATEKLSFSKPITRAKPLLWKKGGDLAARPALSFLCGGEDRFEVESVFCGLFLANAPDFIDDVILGHNYSPNSSSGVQRTGHS